MKRAANRAFLRDFSYEGPQRAKTSFTLVDVKCSGNKEPDGLYKIFITHDAPNFGDVDGSIDTMRYVATITIKCCDSQGLVVHARAIEVECNYYVSGSVNCECDLVGVEKDVTASDGLLVDLRVALEARASKCWSGSILNNEEIVLDGLFQSENEEGEEHNESDGAQGGT